MAYPKAFIDILARLTRIEEKLDQSLAVQASPSSSLAPLSIGDKDLDNISDLVPNYEKATIGEILQRVKNMDSVDISRLIEFEQVHKNRSSLLESLEDL